MMRRPCRVDRLSGFEYGPFKGAQWTLYFLTMILVESNA